MLSLLKISGRPHKDVRHEGEVRRPRICASMPSPGRQPDFVAAGGLGAVLYPDPFAAR
ncbi:MAG TPA: hypothetical protein VMR43_12640 [Variovorax sp.]|nr:hypothetical protein [Variovorax sp.]